MTSVVKAAGPSELGSGFCCCCWACRRAECVSLIVFPASHMPSICICRARCWQPGIRTPTPPGVSEDCLYLNVFVPQNMVSLTALAMFSVKAALLEIPNPCTASMVCPVLSWLVLGSLRPEGLSASLVPPGPPLISCMGAWCMVIWVQFSKRYS